MAGELILVVEDTPRSAKLLLDVLPFHGYRVAHAPDGESALRACAASVPDVVLMDIHLPGLDGIETMRRLRRMPSMARAVFVAVTASVMPHEVAALEQVGCDLLHSKPIEIDRLIAEIRGLLSERGDSGVANARPAEPAADHQ